MGYGGGTQGPTAAVMGNQVASVHQDHAAPQDLHQENNASTGMLAMPPEPSSPGRFSR
jgi:hypothetical protein